MLPTPTVVEQNSSRPLMHRDPALGTSVSHMPEEPAEIKLRAGANPASGSPRERVPRSPRKSPMTGGAPAGELAPASLTLGRSAYSHARTRAHDSEEDSGSLELVGAAGRPDAESGAAGPAQSSTDTSKGVRRAAPKVLGIRLDWLALALLLVQTTAGQLLARVSRTSGTGEPYITSTAVVMSEAIKFVVSVGMVVRAEGSLHSGLRTLHGALIAHPADMLMLAVPGITYVVQNNLLFVGISNLDVGTLSVLVQLKLLTTACFAVTMLGKRLSARKWAALFILFVGCSVVQIGAAAAPAAVRSAVGPHQGTQVNGQQLRSAGGERTGNHHGVHARALASVPEPAASLHNAEVDPPIGGARHVTEPHLGSLQPLPPVAVGAVVTAGDPIDHHLAQRVDYDRAPATDMWIGSMAVVAAATLSGFAGVFLERILKRGGTGRTTLWIRNVQLSAFGIVMGLAATLTTDYAAVTSRGFLAAYTPIVWAVVVNLALGGVVVAVVMKYTDNIRKGFAGAASTVITPVMSWMFLGTALPGSLLFGGLLVGIATALYSVPDAGSPERAAAAGSANRRG